MNDEISRIRRERWFDCKRKHHESDVENDKIIAINKARRPPNNNHEQIIDIDLTLSDDSEIEFVPKSLNYKEDKSNHETKASLMRKVLNDNMEHKSRGEHQSIRSNDVKDLESKILHSSTAMTSNQFVESSIKISILSYNIWFEDVHQAKRMEHISEIIRSKLKHKPTFLGLQEVTPQLLSYLKPLLRSQGYYIICQDGVSYGVAIGVLIQEDTVRGSMGEECQSIVLAEVIDSGFIPYQLSQMGRGLLWVHAKLKKNGHQLLFCTTHLESYLRDNDGSNERAIQIQEASQFCKTEIESKKNRINFAFITGDLNWDDERKRGRGANDDLLQIMNQGSTDQTKYWEDAWILFKKDIRGDGYTYDSKISPMLRGNLRRRFDRCLILCPDKNIQIQHVDLIGKVPIEGMNWKKEKYQWTKNGRKSGDVSYDLRPLCPSDHFGLLSTFFYRPKP